MNVANMLTGAAVMIGLIVFCLFLPERYDPALRLMDWLEKRRDDRKG